MNHYPVEGAFYSLHKGVFSNCLKVLYYLTAEIDDVRHRSTDIKKMDLYKKVRIRICRTLQRNF